MLNSVQLLGNLGSDPELRVTPTGQNVLNFSVATTESYKDRNGQWKENTEWHKVALWGDSATRLAQRLQKGSKVFVQGSIHTESWEKDGQKHYATRIKAQRVLLVGGVGAQGKQETRERQPGEDDDLPY